MIEDAFLIIGRNGINGVRKSKPKLRWDEIAMKIHLDVPDELFDRPQLEATISVDPEKITPNTINPDLILNTKDLIEQAAGVKIDFKVIPMDKDENGE